MSCFLHTIVRILGPVLTKPRIRAQQAGIVAVGEELQEVCLQAREARSTFARLVAENEVPTDGTGEPLKEGAGDGSPVE